MTILSLDNTQQIDLPSNINLQELMTPITNLANAMNIDISSKIDSYLEMVLTEVTDKMDFRSAAIVIQQTALIYGKKVDYLNQLLENILLNQPQRKARKRRTEKQLINDFTLQKDFDLNQVPFEDFYTKCEQLQTRKGLQLMSKQVQSMLQARQEMDNSKIEMGPIYNSLIYDNQLISIIQKQQLRIENQQQNDQSGQQQMQQQLQQDQQQDIDNIPDANDQQQNINIESYQYQDDNYNQDEDLNMDMLNTQDEKNQNKQIQINIENFDLENFDISMLQQLDQFVNKNVAKIMKQEDTSKNDFSKYIFKRYKVQNNNKLDEPQCGIIYKFQEQDQSFNENNILMRYTIPDKLFQGIQTPIVENYMENMQNDVAEMLRSQVVRDEQFDGFDDRQQYDQYIDNQYSSQQNQYSQQQEQQQDLVSVQINQHINSQSIKVPSDSTQNISTIKSISEPQQQKKKVIQKLFTTEYIQWVKKLENLVKKYSEFNVKQIKDQILDQKQKGETNLDQLSQETGNSKTRCFVSALFLANEGKLDIKQQDDKIIFDIK